MDIQIQVNDQPVSAFLALPASGTGPGLLVLHAWWGLKPFIKQLCERLAGQGFVALAPDLYNGPTANTIDEAKALTESADWQRVGDTVMAAKDYLLAHPANTTQKIGVMGFSMGAYWTLVAATRAPQQVAAAVVFYGIGEGDWGKMQAKFLGHFSDVDEWEPLEGIQAMEKDMRAAGADATFDFYPGLAHWFFESDRPEYDPAAAELAWQRTVSFLRDNL
ncbi:MAG: dienelactone hydrolase family protein [Chloroflexi bacterium HGW-Chloroflexi-6]|nr:MAG: dienelactone hydrolase family protein [Chloroflexi bacterium HGW-Chloroflexi-6]